MLEKNTILPCLRNYLIQKEFCGERNIYEHARNKDKRPAKELNEVIK